MRRSRFVGGSGYRRRVFTYELFDLCSDSNEIEELLSNPADFILLNDQGKRFCREDLDVQSLYEAILLQNNHSADLVCLGPVKRESNSRQSNYPLEALNKYAKACRLKIDDEFGKNPYFLRYPFEVVKQFKVSPKMKCSLGGLLINEKAQVLNREREVMPGLYAAGEIVGEYWVKNRLLEKDWLRLRSLQNRCARSIKNLKWSAHPLQLERDNS